jgi:hypothetical protein
MIFDSFKFQRENGIEDAIQTSGGEIQGVKIECFVDGLCSGNGWYFQRIHSGNHGAIKCAAWLG